MPKYYRFRATTPTRKLKRVKTKEKDKEIEVCEKIVANTGASAEPSWLDLTLTCAPAPAWYLRRTWWRETPPLMGLPRELAAGLRASMQFTNRPIFVIKIPNVRSQDFL